MSSCVLLFDHRFRQAPDGAVYSPASYGYGLLSQRYLGVFDDLTIVGRVDTCADEFPPASAVHGPGVRLESMGSWRGLRGLPRPALRTLRSVWRCGQQDGRGVVLIAVLPGALGVIGAAAARVRGVPYAVEVVGDIAEALRASRRGVVPRVAAWLAGAAVRFTVRGAVGAAYVTENALQQRYPPRAAAVTGVYSSIQLTGDAFVETVGEPHRGSRVELVGVGSLERPYKGFSVLLDALHLVDSVGDAALPEWHLTIVGGGRLLPELRRQADTLGLTDKVILTGHVTGQAAVRTFLDAADLFVLPSLTEGLPRALIEAMARGKPAVATSVGGVPELVHADAQVPRDDPDQMAGAIRRAIADPQWRRRHAELNLAVARRYSLAQLATARNDFYRAVQRRVVQPARSHR